MSIIDKVLSENADIVAMINAGKLKAINNLVGKAMQLDKKQDPAKVLQAFNEHFHVIVPEKAPPIEHLHLNKGDYIFSGHYEMSGKSYKDAQGMPCRASDIKLTVSIEYNPLTDDFAKVEEYLLKKLRETQHVITAQLVWT